MKKALLLLLSGCFLIASSAQTPVSGNLHYNSLPQRWDEALPLGNGMLGVLIWEKNGRLRFSLDRADLWDDRPALDLSHLTYKRVTDAVLTKQYEGALQKLGDDPYDNVPYPTKIPAAALEFDIAALGKVKTAALDIHTATAKIAWLNGAKLETFVHATEPYGAFKLTGANGILPILVPPAYTVAEGEKNDPSHSGQALVKLGYAKGVIKKGAYSITYIQPGSLGFSYEVSVCWRQKGNTTEGIWSITSHHNGEKAGVSAEDICKNKTSQSYANLLLTHRQWWTRYWAQSSVSLPDSLLQRQYELEMYKFGGVARKGAPPITLQAVWTADNGLLPPWHGDFHNDLNTQLSYWPAYTSNHLREASSFTDWLWATRDESKRFTRQYFQTKGIDVPGVTTISGKPIGGWIQYSLSPTVGAWLAQHFYWQWKYSMDQNFLQNRAYPFLHDVAVFLSEVTVFKNGKRVLPLSTSPEYHDNSMQAWYTSGNTNYDVALMHFAYSAASETALAMGKPEESVQWSHAEKQLPELVTDETGLMMAPGEDRKESHRHHSNLMSIYPLGLLNPEKPADKRIIDSSLRWMEHTGTSAWCGYSFSWAASLYARAKDGEKAAENLRIFSTNFCSANSFHLNGDQKGGQYSAFTYRPFTLEGNFAFAQGVHEMLLQSYTGVIEVFPAIPAGWANVSFRDLRTEGAFLVTANRVNGLTRTIRIRSEKGGVARIKLGGKDWNVADKQGVVNLRHTGDVLAVTFKKGGSITLKNK
ncbi:MAG: glycoside hydrolase N-terminal domain-containing protein [Bacteroidetes bacterium]|nr:glycoside hydrolase N-terminal domain-containing protein [Bacteroidota bacterium]